jgi:hypothetical protein
MSIVLAASCTHLPCMYKGYDRFLKKTADKWGVNKFIHLGDLFSWDSISFHEKNPSLYTSTDEFYLAQKQLKLIQGVSKKWEWFIGNHDCLPQRQAEKAGLSSHFLKSYQQLWEVDWVVHSRFAKIEHDGVIYSHGEAGKGGQQAALKQARDNWQSTVIGHYHAQACVDWGANEHHLFFGASAGCGLDRKKLAMDYGMKFPAKPILGCVIVVNGKQAYFEPMKIV